jgi:hypothetical protein
MKSTIRYCDDIGMFAYDRGIPQSCVHATDFCSTNCYNDKLYKIYPNMRGKDEKNELFWKLASGNIIKNDLARKRKQTTRVRLMTRGEAFSNFDDIGRVESILAENPDTEWWIPTRSWRNDWLRGLVRKLSDKYKNAHILASTDPTTTDEEWATLKAQGWSTMFFGDDDQRITPNGDKHFLCPKTHGGVKGACGVCKRGCFNSTKRVDVHLSQH